MMICFWNGVQATREWRRRVFKVDFLPSPMTFRPWIAKKLEQLQQLQLPQLCCFLRVILDAIFFKDIRSDSTPASIRRSCVAGSTSASSVPHTANLCSDFLPLRGYLMREIHPKGRGQWTSSSMQPQRCWLSVAHLDSFGIVTCSPKIIDPHWWIPAANCRGQPMIRYSLLSGFPPYKMFDYMFKKTLSLILR